MEGAAGYVVEGLSVVVERLGGEGAETEVRTTSGFWWARVDFPPFEISNPR